MNGTREVLVVHVLDGSASWWSDEGVIKKALLLKRPNDIAVPVDPYKGIFKGRKMTFLRLVPNGRAPAEVAREVRRAMGARAPEPQPLSQPLTPALALAAAAAQEAPARSAQKAAGVRSTAPSRGIPAKSA